MKFIEVLGKDLKVGDIFLDNAGVTRHILYRVSKRGLKQHVD